MYEQHLLDAAAMPDDMTKEAEKDYKFPIATLNFSNAMGKFFSMAGAEYQIQIQELLKAFVHQENSTCLRGKCICFLKYVAERVCMSNVGGFKKNHDILYCRAGILLTQEAKVTRSSHTMIEKDNF